MSAPRRTIEKALRAALDAAFDWGEWDREHSDKSAGVVYERTLATEARLRKLIGLPPSDEAKEAARAKKRAIARGACPRCATMHPPHTCREGG